MDIKGRTILQIIPSLVTGGAERGCIDMAAAIVAAGGRAIVVSEGGGLVHELARAGAQHIVLPVASKSPLQIWRNARRLVKLIRDEKVDLVHARSRAPAWSAYLAAKRTDTPFVTTFHAPYGAHGWLKRRYNRVMTKGERVIAVSHFVARHIVETYQVDPNRIVTIHRGIDPEFFDPKRVTRERMARLVADWSLPDDKHVILLPARLTRWKGHAILLGALAQLGRKDVVAVLVGDAQGRTGYVRELAQLSAQLGIAENVLMPGGCSDMAAAYTLASVVVSPAIEPEAFGRVIAEAQAMERPVIVSNVGACQETVRQGETGWIVPVGDVAALTTVLQQALAMTPTEWAAMGSRGRAFVLANYTKARMCSATLDVYRQVLRAP